MKRGYLLPHGCKDLIDAIHLKPGHAAGVMLPKLPALVTDKAFEKKQQPVSVPEIKGQIFVTGQTTVAQLATLLEKKPFVIIADLMSFGIFASLNQSVGFDAILQVARKYGFVAIRND